MNFYFYVFATRLRPGPPQIAGVRASVSLFTPDVSTLASPVGTRGKSLGMISAERRIGGVRQELPNYANVFLLHFCTDSLSSASPQHHTDSFILTAVSIL